ncbi:MAG: hypothetical protein ACLQFI_18725 [Methylocella sp.]
MRVFKLASGLALVSAVLVWGSPALPADKPTRFWNLTSSTVTDLRLALAGTGNFGENQCLNDKDAEVDHDERLRVTGVGTGQYDVEIGFSGGRVCIAKNLSIEAGNVFSVEDKDLVNCSK